MSWCGGLRMSLCPRLLPRTDSCCDSWSADAICPTNTSTCGKGRAKEPHGKTDNIITASIFLVGGKRIFPRLTLVHKLLQPADEPGQFLEVAGNHLHVLSQPGKKTNHTTHTREYRHLSRPVKCTAEDSDGRAVSREKITEDCGGSKRELIEFARSLARPRACFTSLLAAPA